MSTPLPIDPHLPEVVRALRKRGALVLRAEPGAGKTTRVPRALYEAGFAKQGQIVVLEPRRIAARASAARVAEEMSVGLGHRVGYQVRFESVSSQATKILFATEGVLMRRLASDPELRGVSTLILDEMHERHLHGDLLLAWARRLREGARPDLALVAMSATLDAGPVAEALGAHTMDVPGAVFEVRLEHEESEDARPLERKVRAALVRLLRGGLDGDVLVFLPGAREIQKAMESCRPVAEAEGLLLLPLHGELPPEEQDRAIKKADRRKVILSTNVAETSLTIDGVVAVIDSGLARTARWSPWTGLSRLRTTPISRASATQRAGRAGRTRAGVAVRLYSAADLAQRPDRERPEIARADLAEMALSLHGLGEDPRRFAYFEPPPPASLDAAESLLLRLGAIEAIGEAPSEASGEPSGAALTPIGERMRALPLHPRLARLVVAAERLGHEPRGALAAALLGERDLRRSRRASFGPGELRAGRRRAVQEVGDSDLEERMEIFESVEAMGLSAQRLREHGLDVQGALRVRRARAQILRALRSLPPLPEEARTEETDPERALSIALLRAFPDRLGRRRRPQSKELVFAEGGSGTLVEESVVREAEIVLAVEAEEVMGKVLIRTAHAAPLSLLFEVFFEELVEEDEVAFDPRKERVQARRVLRFGALALEDKALPLEREGPLADRVARALAEAALRVDRGRFFDADALAQLERRVAFARRFDESIPALEESLIEDVLREAASGRRSFDELVAAEPLTYLRAALEPSRERLDRLAPEQVAIPGRPRVPVCYEVDRPPWIASRLQDFFGATEGPSVGGGREPLLLHLLAPNQRAVQVTTDLAGFWEKHYPSLRKELMRRYPRHAWPEDPKVAEPSRPGRRKS